ncbi:urea carboxylase [Ulvibacterium sp.]|uniref:urea carboxylase n=1 Tax=Ulvibacterium sp. TaxID=2665914 RepID=UPI00260C51A5|nr:urea carboxylase [Ulvibacterium sp.]
MMQRILIANRGEIAVRIIGTLKKMGKVAVAIYNEADTNTAHMLEADEAHFIGSGTVSETYLNIERILEVVQKYRIDGVHPGYGLLSENTVFANSLEKIGVTFIGPTSDQIQAFGLKHEARKIALKSDLPILKGTPLLSSLTEAEIAAKRLGFPVILKSTGGGGGIGMHICYSLQTLKEAFHSTISLAQKNFSNGGVFLEKFLVKARHVEVQIFGDGEGGGLVLGDRDCSIQRRSQKIIEETPAPNIPNEIREKLYQGAKNLMKLIKYRSAGTIEFLYDEFDLQFYFLEVNTRLQVEHTITEEVFGIDIVEAMILLQEGRFVFPENLSPTGAAMQFRLYAEDPYKNYMPATGKITKIGFPETARIDGWVREGSEVSPFFDPLLAKIIIKAKNREECVKRAAAVLASSKVEGVETNLEFLTSIAQSEEFASGRISTKFLDDFQYRSNALDILDGGTFTTIQDYPGRLGYWMVGIPPSGPMDNRSFRIGNVLLGNPENTAGLEITLVGPRIQFRRTTTFTITGARIGATLGDKTILNYTVYTAQKGDILSLGKITDAGQRSYLLFGGGLDVSEYLGSKSTFSLGVMGGHNGRVLKVGDVIHLNEYHGQAMASRLVFPKIPEDITLDLMYGPHGAPDFFTEAYLQKFLDAEWSIHFNSSRTGVRLLGPSPEWTRDDGGEAGLHPSNIHDNAYAVGTIDFTGDTPIILGPDGPSLGGFVCPFTIIKADLWKVGQLSSKSKIRFNLVSYEQALAKEKAEELFIKNLGKKIPQSAGIHLKDATPILDQFFYKENQVIVRQSGDDNLLIEIGALELNLELRLIIHKIFEAFRNEGLKGVIDLTPGVRSLQIHFDANLLDRSVLLEKTAQILTGLEHSRDISVPSRIVHLPLSWNDPQAKLAMEKYHTTVRSDAPWSPDNIEFIRRINGLGSIQEVQDTILGANYLVIGLGDVYLGAPIATPLDPRKRLVTTKYNPARTWTPENAVGIGGAYLCIYGMEGPGGYQLFGRTLQMWNTYPKGIHFTNEKPFLLRFFDQIKFYLVSAEELLQIRRDFPQGRYPLKIEETTFSLSDYKKFLSENQASIESFQRRQKEAFEMEKEEWIRSGKLTFSQEENMAEDSASIEIPEGSEGISSPFSAVVWKLLVKEGDTIELEQPIAILESMKMEMNILSTASGKVTDVCTEEGKEIHSGDYLFIIKTA